MESAVSALTTAMTDIGTQATSVVTGAIPIALPIIGIGVVVAIGVKMFKKLTNRA